jgi:WD40 repeat protein
MCPALSITSQAITPDSQTLAVGAHSFTDRRCGGGDSSLTLWNLQTGKPIKTLVTGGVGEAMLAGEEYKQQEPPDSWELVGDIAHDVEFTPDGQLLVGAMSDKTIKLWNAKNGELVRTLKGHKYAVRAVEITPDGQNFITGGSDKTIKIWNRKTGRVIRTLQESEIVFDLHLSPDGKRLISITQPYGFSDTAQLKIWDWQSGKVIRTFSIAANLAQPVIFSPDGQIIITTSTDNSIKLWNARTGARIRSLTSHTNKILSLAITQDGQFLASSSGDQSVKLWNFKTGQLIRTIPNIGFVNLAFSPDGKTLLISDGSSNVQLWNWRLPEKIRTIEDNSNMGFTPDGQTLLTINWKIHSFQVWR